MPTHCDDKPIEFTPPEGRAVVAAFDGGRITSDAGAPLLREVAGRLDLFARMSAAVPDLRDPDLTEHEQRHIPARPVLGLACGWEDLNDHHGLRVDPLVQVARPAGGPTTTGRWRPRPPCAGSRTGPAAGPASGGRSGWSRCSSSRSGPTCPTSWSSTSTRPTTRSTAGRKGGSSTAATAGSASSRRTCSAANGCRSRPCGRRTSTRPTTAARSSSRRSAASAGVARGPHRVPRRRRVPPVAAAAVVRPPRRRARGRAGPEQGPGTHGRPGHGRRRAAVQSHRPGPAVVPRAGVRGRVVGPPAARHPPLRLRSG